MKKKFNIKVNSSAGSNNGGYSLIELIIAISILAVVALTCAMFMNSGIDLFNRINNRETLQYKTQLALMQMKENTVSAIGIANETDKLYVVNKDREGNKTLYTFELEKNSNVKLSKLYIVEYTYTINGTKVELHEVSKQPVCSGVSEFSTTINPASNGSTKASSLSITLKITNGSRSYTKTYVVGLKADPDYVKNKLVSDSSMAETLARQVDTSDGTHSA